MTGTAAKPIQFCFDVIPAALLRQTVDTSIRNGVVGWPFLIVDGEPFFDLEKLRGVGAWLATGGW